MNKRENKQQDQSREDRYSWDSDDVIVLKEPDEDEQEDDS